jgi:phosphomannomutase
MSKEIALLMDIDGTLTPPRQPLLVEMADALKGLKVPFNVAAGSDRPLVEPQFLKPLWDFGYRRKFESFVDNGATQLTCDFTEEYKIAEAFKFSFADHLGAADNQLLLDSLKELDDIEDFKLADNLKVIGERVTDRGSMVNYAPIGRTKVITDEALQNRNDFVAFDKSTGYRKKIMAHLTAKLGRVMTEKGLNILFGGETSFDLNIRGKDKTLPVMKFLEAGYEKVAFMGDALFDGGNDSVVQDLVDNWDPNTPCPVEAIPVTSWENSIEIFNERGWL